MSRSLHVKSSIFESIFHRNTMSVVRFSLNDAMNAAYEAELIIKTVGYPNQNNSFENDYTGWLHQAICVEIELDGQVSGGDPYMEAGKRFVHGIITEAKFLYQQGVSYYHYIKFSPPLSLGRLNHNYKIYQNQRVIDILGSICDDYQQPYRHRFLVDSTGSRLAYRDMVTQYDENDYFFFERLCSEWLINYWFIHDEQGVILILSESLPGVYGQPRHLAYEKICYFPPDANQVGEHFYEFSVSAKAVPGSYAHADYDYNKPSAYQANRRFNPHPFDANVKRYRRYDDIDPYKNNVRAPRHLEMYRYPAELAQPNAGNYPPYNMPYDIDELRLHHELERNQTDHYCAYACGNIRGLEVATVFKLESHPHINSRLRWVVKSCQMEITEVAQTTESAEVTEPQSFKVKSTFELFPEELIVRPQYKPRPQAGLDTAVVVGPKENNSVYTDRYGRIKIQFHWDRYGTHDENSSCWVRVSQPWAGSRMGASFIPRIGQEVLINYISGDPDQPVCIGKVHNADNNTLWNLTENDSLSGIRTRELPNGNVSTGRSNELVFDDTKEHIQLQLRSDHGHSMLSLGDIYCISGSEGRTNEPRGKGFELRTDEWGGIRAAKGLYVSTFPRNDAQSTTMDAKEAIFLMESSQSLI